MPLRAESVYSFSNFSIVHTYTHTHIYKHTHTLTHTYTSAHTPHEHAHTLTHTSRAHTHTHTQSTFSAHTSAVQDVSCSSFQANTFASVGDDKYLILWDERVRDKPSQKVKAHDGEINCVSFSPHKKELLLTGDPACVKRACSVCGFVCVCLYLSFSSLANRACAGSCEGEKD